MPDTAIEHAERIATLETKMEALTESVKEQTKKIDELLTIVQQARGARYVLLGFGGIIGGILTLAFDYGHKVAGVLQAVTK